MRKHGKSERERKFEQRIGDLSVVAHVINNDGQPRARFSRRRKPRWDPDEYMNRVGLRPMERESEAGGPTGGDIHERKFVATGNVLEGLPERTFASGISKGNVDVIGEGAA